MSLYKTTLITGASQGIGLSLANEFAKNGHDLVLVARSEDKLLKIAQNLGAQYDIKVTPLPFDLIPTGSAIKLFTQLAEMEITIDILVNNAGMMQVEKLYESDMDVMNNLMQLNINSLVNMTRLFVGPMLSRGYGKVINVASIASFMPTPTFSVYGASKAFVLSFSESIAEEMKDSGISVTCVCPGFTQTDMLSHAEGLEKYIPTFLKASPEGLAADAYKAAMNNEVIFIDKLANKMLVQWAKHYPRWIVRGVTGFFSRFT
ncbi:SDR family oxidoreductase [Alteromonadaceae bacterium M269]|nr:SDR family oxidoreductase [Alteromonadaceae bacterium M269]